MSHSARVPLSAMLILCPIISAQAQDLPAGPGKETVAAACGSCHDVNRIRAGYTPDGWRSVIQMMKNVDAPVPKDQWDTVTEYLIKNFPEKPRPAAAVIEGPVQASIKEWPVPTPGSRPHDPARRQGRVHLVDRAVGQQARPP